MHVKLTILLYGVLITIIKSEIIEKKVISKETIYECINNVYKVYSDLNTLLFAYNGTLSKGLHFLNSTVIITENYNKKFINKLWKFNFHIIIVDDIKKLNMYLNDLFMSANWNNNAKFAIVYFGKDKPDAIFKVTWRHYVINIILIYSANGSILTHYPYKNGACGRSIIPEQIAHCSNNTLSLFENKLPANLEGCELKLMGLNLKPYVIDINGDKEDPKEAGLEVTIIHAIAKKMNFSENYVHNPYSHWGFLFPNNSFSFMLNDLYERKADVIFGK